MWTTWEADRKISPDKAYLLQELYIALTKQLSTERIEETIDPEQDGPAPFMRDSRFAAQSLVELSVPIRRKHAADHVLCGKASVASPRSVDKAVVAWSIPPSEPFDTYDEIHAQR